MAYLGKTPSQAVRSRFYFTASGGETSLSPSNVSGLLFTDANFVDVSLNGVALVSGTDYTATPSTNTISGLAALTASDVVEIIVYDVFSVFGGNFTADLNLKDNVKSVYGDGNDLQIFHDGSHSRIAEAGTGDLKIGTSGGAVKITANGTSQEQIIANQGGAVTLAHSGPTKLATASTGVDITGAFTATDGCTITTADNSTQLTLTSTDDDASEGPRLDLRRDSASPADNDAIGTIRFLADDDSGSTLTYAEIQTHARDVSAGATDSEMQFLIRRGGNTREAIQLNENSVVFNDAGDDVDFRIESDGNANIFFVDGANDRVGLGTNSPSSVLHVNHDIPTVIIEDNNNGTGGTSYRPHIQFIANGTEVGSVGMTESVHFTIEAENQNSAKIAFKTGGSERLKIESDGDIRSDTTVFQMGAGTGGISLTTNDGYGNANIAFNHEAGVPEQSSGSSGRITVDVDNATSRMGFELKSSTTAGSGVSLTPVLQLYGAAGTGGYGTLVSEGGTAGRVDIQQGSCKAWVRWTMISNHATADSYNVTSVGDDGTGESIVTLNNAMNNSNWAVVLGGTAAQTSGGTLALDSSGFLGQGTSPYRTTKIFHTRTVSGGGSSNDAADNNAAVFGDQA